MTSAANTAAHRALRQQQMLTAARIPHVFISYSRADHAYVSMLADHLATNGVPVWRDTQIPSGQRWDHVVKRRIETCAAMVVVMSPAAEDSVMVANEIQFARRRGKDVLPLLLAGEPLFGLLHTQYDDVSGGAMPGRKFMNRLRALARVQRRLSDAK